MNNAHQAKNGFKTFVVTLVISLGVFAAVYYLTSYPSYEMDIDESTGGTRNEVDSPLSSVEGENVLGETDSPFANLNEQEISTPRRTVLSGEDVISEEEEEMAAMEEDEIESYEEDLALATETTETTVPDTGTLGMTFSLFTSMAILAGGLYYVYLGPRNLALKSFEEQILN